MWADMGFFVVCLFVCFSNSSLLKERSMGTGGGGGAEEGGPGVEEPCDCVSGQCFIDDR